MCLAIPAQICQMPEAAGEPAVAELLGVRRNVNLDLLEEESIGLGDWILIHVGFAMSKISAEEAGEQLEILAQLGEAGEVPDNPSS